MVALSPAVAADTETRRAPTQHMERIPTMNYTSEQLLEAADILDAAHDVLLRDGWLSTKSSFFPTTQRCMESAVCVALRPEEAASPFALLAGLVVWGDTLACLVHDALDSRGYGFMWNDADGRTEDEVFDALRAVAKELREQAS